MTDDTLNPGTVAGDTENDSKRKIMTFFASPAGGLPVQGKVPPGGWTAFLLRGAR